MITKRHDLHVCMQDNYYSKGNIADDTAILTVGIGNEEATNRRYKHLIIKFKTGLKNDVLNLRDQNPFILILLTGILNAYR